MAKLNTQFDSQNYEDFDGAFDPVPADTYQMKVTNSSIEDTKAKTGRYIKFEFTIIEGEYKGRKVWGNLNIVNPNPIAVEIAQKELATLCRAVKKTSIIDTQELHGIPFWGRVKIKPAEGDWPAKNQMISYKPLDGAKPETPSEVTTPEGGVPWA